MASASAANGDAVGSRRDAPTVGTMAKLHFSTDPLRPRDRFEYWRDDVVLGVFGIEAEIEPGRDRDFEGQSNGFMVGTATVMRGKATPYRMRRSSRTVAPSPDGSLHIWHIIHGGGLFVSDAATQTYTPGTLSTRFDYSPGFFRPDPALVGPDGLTESWNVKIPLETIAGLPLKGGSTGRCRHMAPTGIDALLRSYVACFAEQAPHLAGRAAEQAILTLANLALAARGAIDAREEVATAAIREGALARAHRLIERGLHRPDLTPARVAAQLGISVRKLHLVFEPSGESFSRHVLARRLARVDHLLREAPWMSVTEAAYAAGFDSLSTFFRCYRAAYGVAPSQRRPGPDGLPRASGPSVTPDARAGPGFLV